MTKLSQITVHSSNLIPPPYQCQIGKCTFAGFTSWACDNGTAVSIGGAQDTHQRSCSPQNAQDSVCGAMAWRVTVIWFWLCVVREMCFYQQHHE